MKGPFPLTVGGFDAKAKMFVHSKTDAHISKQIAESGSWEVYETQLLQAMLFSGATFVDVGANIGYYCVLASGLVDSAGQVFAFEPEQDNFELLEKNIDLNDLTNIVAVQAALSDTTATGHVYLNEENRGDHQIYQQQSNNKNGVVRDKQAIQLLNGAGFFAALKSPVNNIDVLKVDTQGAESAVIKGLMPIIQASLPKLKILIEFTPYSLRQAGSNGMELLDLIISLGLPMQLVDHLGHKLMPITYAQMQQWILETDADEGNEGFINLLVGS